MTPNASLAREPRHRPQSSASRRNLLWAIFAILFLIVLRLLLAPDPAGAVLFARARRLETAGLARPALRQYHLLAKTHPQSPYAPRALSREAALWLNFARAGETTAFAEAVTTYRRVATTYPGTQFASQSLLAIGSISLDDLNDTDAARAAYEEALKGYENNRAVASEATLRLGLVAQRARDGKTAQRWFQQVMARYAGETERCAQAQYALGETYENLFRNREWARNAYEATLRTYSKTVWAGKAKERLGLLLYHEAAPRARRVLIQTPAGIVDTQSDTLLDGVRLVLAARGIEAGTTVLRGWSLAPFFAGYLPSNPGRAPRFGPAAWETVAANAGLRTRVSDGGDAKSALQTLQSELDAAHLTLVYSGEKSGSWRLATGYDSARDSVFLQQGARLANLSSRDFARDWNRSSPLGGSFSLVSFEAPGEQVNPKLAPISNSLAPTIAADASNTPRYATATLQKTPLSTPGYLYQLKPLVERDAHRRTLRRAAEWLRRTHEGDVLLGGEALRTIAAELRRFAKEPPAEVETPAVEKEIAREEADIPAAPEEPTARTEGVPALPPNPAPNAAVSSAPTVSAPAVSAPPRPGARALPNRQPNLARLAALLAWREEPLQRWLDARRAAAAYCDVAASRLKSASARHAADSLRDALTALEDARALLPTSRSVGGAALSASTRRALAAAADKLDAAREAERRAADSLDDAVR